MIFLECLVAGLFHDFRRHVLRGAGKAFETTYRWVYLSSESEVGEFDFDLTWVVLILHNEHVVRFDVPVHDVLFVEEFKGE